MMVMTGLVAALEGVKVAFKGAEGRIREVVYNGGTASEPPCRIVMPCVTAVGTAGCTLSAAAGRRAGGETPEARHHAQHHGKLIDVLWIPLIPRANGGLQGSIGYATERQTRQIWSDGKN